MNDEELERMAQEEQKLRETLRAYEQLQELPAWKIIAAQLEEQITIRSNTILLTPLASQDKIFEQEYMKGEIAGLKLVLQYPRLTIENVKFELDQLKGAQDE